ncbi:MAG: molybdopterin dinucleotide binding domain-containing protein, partial [Acidimicrobiales bacterium]
VAPAPVPAPLAPGALRLIAQRSLWDNGALVQHSPSLAQLHPPWQVLVHPDDMGRLGLTAGRPVRISSERGLLIAPLRADAGVPAGSIVVPFNLPGGSASALIDAGTAATDVRLETLGGALLGEVRNHGR